MVLAIETMNCPVSVAAGTASDCSSFGDKTVYVTGTFTGTYQVQISADGTTFVTEGSDVTAAGTVAVSKLARKIRLNCSAYTSGTPAATLVAILSTAR